MPRNYDDDTEVVVGEKVYTINDLTNKWVAIVAIAMYLLGVALVLWLEWK